MRVSGLLLVCLLALLPGCQLFLPIADFSASITEGDLPLEVTFTDLSIVGTDQTLNWRWDFGDGNTSTAKTPVHTYTKRGVYSVRLEVETARGTDEIIYNNLINVREVVRFLDPNLDAVVRRALNRDVGSIRAMDMEGLTTFDGGGAGITSLAGLQYATGLENLYLDENSIADITPLGKLGSLRSLNLRDNQITDVSPLNALTQLRELDLGINTIVNIVPLANLFRLELLNLERNSGLSDIRSLQHMTTLRELSLAFTGILQNEIIDGAGNGDGLASLAGLTKLTFLDLAATDIHDLQTLRNLTALEELILFECRIVDIAPLAELVNLTNLQLSSNLIVNVGALSVLDQLREVTLQMNQITSIAPLVLNLGLGNNDIVRLTGNPLDSTSLCSAVPTLELRGVIVELEERCSVP